MPGDDDMPPEPIAAMLAQLEDETAHMTPEYLAGKLAEVEAEYARRSMDSDEMIERLAAEAERGYEPHQLRRRPDRPILHEESAGPMRWHTCAGCGRPWPCPDAPLTEREQDRLDEWRMDGNDDLA